MTATSVSLPAPFGGWNTRDNVADMEPTDAVELTNMLPRLSDVYVRRGFTKPSTGYSGQVETILTYAGGTNSKMFGCCGSNIYDATAGGAIGAAVVTGLSNARWQYVNSSTAGGNFMSCVNGSDDLRLFDGSTWYAVNSGSTPYAITGVATATFSHVELFKTRIFFIQKGTLTAWYLPINSVAGAANPLYFNSIARRGGHLVAMGTWTIDAGYGVDDYAVWITSEGEVIVYGGTDPSSSSTWSLHGVWQLGSPVGTNCMMKYAGDLIVITQDGLVPLASALQSSRLNPKVALTDKIQPTVSESISSVGTNFGWSTLYYAKGNMLILNVPMQEGADQEQYVMNTITKNWARFTGWNANCWAIFGDEPYFGGNGYIGRAWDGNDDAGSNIQTTVRQAFNYFGSRGRLKRFTMLRPIIKTDGYPSLIAAVDVDFEENVSTTLLSFSPTGSALWDSGIWDTSIWGSGVQVQKSWQGAAGVGYCASVRLQSASSGIQVSWVSTDILMEPGAFL